MATYCECGSPATVFYDEDGNELPEPMCEECWLWLLEKTEELFGRE